MKSFQSFISEEGEKIKRGKEVSVGKNTVKINPDSEELKEVAPPTAKAERMVKHIKKSYSKDGKLTDKEKQIAYATAWKQHNQEDVELEGDELEEGLRKRLATGALAAGLGAAALSGGAAKAGNWSGQVNARYGSVPAVATNQSVSGAVDKALSNMGSSHSASEIKGKRAVTGSGNLSYSGTLGKAPEASNPKVKDDGGKPTVGRTSSTQRTPTKVVLKKDKGDDKIVKDVKNDDGKPIKYNLADKGDDKGGDKSVASTSGKSGGDEPAVRPGRGPAGQQLRGAIASIRNATGEAGREARHQAALGPSHVNGRQQTAAQRLRGAIDAIRTATDKARQMNKKDLKAGYVPSFSTYIRESAVPGKPAERLGAVTAIPKDERDAARERTLAKAKAARAAREKGMKEEIEIEEGMTMDDFKRERRRIKDEPPIRKRGGISAPEDQRTIGGQANRDNKDYWASVVGKNRDRGAGNKAKRRAAELNKEEFEIEEGMTMKDFKANRRKLKRREASADAKKRGHVGKEWYNSGRTYSPDEAKFGRAKLDDAERSTRHRSAVDPDAEDDNYSADKTKNPKKLRKQKAMGEIGESLSFSDFMEARRMDKEGVDRGDAGREQRAAKAKASLAAKAKRDTAIDKYEKSSGRTVDRSKSVEYKAHAKNHPGSRQEPKVKGAKETPSETHSRRVNRQVARVLKHGPTSKEKRENEAMSKHTSRFD